MVSEPESDNPPNTQQPLSITLSELHQHNTRSDLWISIHGKVYDVTPWLRSHPGGDLPLLNLAGQDATDAFVAFHPPAAWAHLDRFLIGRLSDYSVSPASKDYRRLVSEFSAAGLFSRKGHTIAILLSIIALCFPLSIYLVLFSDSFLAHFVAAAVMGFLWIQTGWIGHDSGHYTVMTNKSTNLLAQFLTANLLTGISIAWWKRNHNAHHIATNCLEYDPDLQHMPIFAVSSKVFNLRSFFYEKIMVLDSVSRFLISHQHLTFYPVMCVARVNLFAQSVILVVTGKNVPNRWREIFGIAVFWIWFPLLVSCLPNWGERVMFVLVSFAVTGIQHVQFCLNHFSSDVYVDQPKGNDWFEKQTQGTLNINNSPMMDWFHGGLNYQVEHHLFPRMPRCHYRKVAPIVKDLCKKHNLTYSAVSFYEANRKTVEVLKSAAMQARDWTNPAPRNLVWEAVNTHG